MKITLPAAVSNFLKEQVVLASSPIDIDENLNICERWVVITAEELFIFGGSELLVNVSLSKIENIHEFNSLSKKTYYINYLSGLEQKQSSLSLHFSGRQNQNMVWIKKIIEIFIQNKHFPAQILNSSQAEKSSNFDSIDNFKNENTNRRILLRLIKYLWKYKKELKIGFAASLLASFTAMIPIFVTGNLIDLLIKTFQQGASADKGAIKLIWYNVFAIAGSKILGELFALIRFRKMCLIGESVTHDLRAEVFSHLQKIDISYFKKRTSGQIITYLTSDISQVWDFLAFGLINITISILTIFSLSFIVLYIDWRLGLLIVFPAPFLIFAIFVHGEKLKKLFLKSSKVWESFVTKVSDSIQGIQVVKIFAKEAFEIFQFRKLNNRIFDAGIVVHKEWTRFWPAIATSIHIVGFAVWVFAIPRILTSPEDPSHLTVGALVSMLIFLGMFMEPILVLGNSSVPFNKALSSAHRFFQILDIRPQALGFNEHAPMLKLKGQIEFRNVNFSYEGTNENIKNVSFKVLPGEVIGIVGQSGSGKSTIVQLILGLVSANSGSIFIDDLPIDKLNLVDLRKQTGVVLQDSFLFQATILENILYGVDGEVDIAEVVNAAKAANAHAFIIQMRFGYDTVVGNRGETLSGGEKQRIILARALLKNAKLLILDEATSAVDSRTEGQIQGALENLFAGKTVIIIAHRLSTLRRVNKLLVFEDGEIKESGDPVELLKIEDGYYRKYHDSQLKLNDNRSLD